MGGIAGGDRKPNEGMMKTRAFFQEGMPVCFELCFAVSPIPIVAVHFS